MPKNLGFLRYLRLHNFFNPCSASNSIRLNVALLLPSCPRSKLHMTRKVLFLYSMSTSFSIISCCQTAQMATYVDTTVKDLSKLGYCSTDVVGSRIMCRHQRYKIHVVKYIFQSKGNAHAVREDQSGAKVIKVYDVSNGLHIVYGRTEQFIRPNGIYRRCEQGLCKEGRIMAWDILPVGRQRSWTYPRDVGAAAGTKQIASGQTPNLLDRREPDNTRKH